MEPKELELTIKEGEGLTVEFKEKYTPNIDRDMVAFSNSKGGHLILGVTDRGEIVGETLTNNLKAVITDLARKCKPSIHLRKIQQSGRLITIEIHGRRRKTI